VSGVCDQSIDIPTAEIQVINIPVHDNTEYQHRKSWYDKQRKKEKNFKPGDKAVVLGSGKMYGKWSGPAKVVRQSGLRTYDI
jgi:hypothetical protein